MDITGIAQVLESQARLSDIPTISASMSKKSVRMKKKRHVGSSAQSCHMIHGDSPTGDQANYWWLMPLVT